MVAIKALNSNASILFLDNFGNIATSSAQAGLATAPTFLQDVNSDEFLNGMGGVSNTKRTVYAATSKNYATSSWINQAAVTASAGFDYNKNQFWMNRTSGSAFSLVYADYSQANKTGSAGTIVVPSNASIAPRLVKQSTCFYRGKILMGHASSSGLLGGGRLIAYDSSSNSVVVTTASLNNITPTPNTVRDVSSPTINPRTGEIYYAISTSNQMFTAKRSDFDSMSSISSFSDALYEVSNATGSAASVPVCLSSYYIPYLHQTWTLVSGRNIIFRYHHPSMYFGNNLFGTSVWSNLVISGSVTGIGNAAHMALLGGIEKAT
jgi:hypothetical protein